MSDEKPTKKEEKAPPAPAEPGSSHAPDPEPDPAKPKKNPLEPLLNVLKKLPIPKISAAHFSKENLRYYAQTTLATALTIPRLLIHEDWLTRCATLFFILSFSFSLYYFPKMVSVLIHYKKWPLAEKIEKAPATPEATLHSEIGPVLFLGEFSTSLEGKTLEFWMEAENEEVLEELRKEIPEIKKVLQEELSTFAAPRFENAQSLQHVKTQLLRTLNRVLELKYSESKTKTIPQIKNLRDGS